MSELKGIQHDAPFDHVTMHIQELVVWTSNTEQRLETEQKVWWIRITEDKETRMYVY